MNLKMSQPCRRTFLATKYISMNSIIRFIFRYTKSIISVNVAGTTWDWYNDGINVNAKIEFLHDHKVKFIWNSGGAQGSWSQNGDILTTTFGGILHKFKLLSKNEATLHEPKRNPPTKITLQGWSFFVLVMFMITELDTEGWQSRG